MRRFEYIQGNQAKFWEVSRRGSSLTVSSGKIGGTPKTRTKQLSDFMAAEQEFDRLIRDKLRRGYVEVVEASATEIALPERHLRLRPRDGSAAIELKPAAARYLLWRMIEVGAMDRQVEAPDLSRWRERASRRLRLEDNPGPGDPSYAEHRALYLELSDGDRSAETGQHGIVGAFKFLVGSDWIVTAKEAGWLADATSNRTPRRHKIGSNQEAWLAEWSQFHDGPGRAAGYVVESV
ncbi:MAG: WGR domain-containing protein [Myxococcota bacterium]